MVLQEYEYLRRCRLPRMLATLYLFTLRFLFLLVMWKAATGLIQPTHAALFGSFRQRGHRGARATTSRLFQEANSSSSSGNTSNPEDEMIARQKEAKALDDRVGSEAEHLLRQRRVFDEMSNFFATKQTIPDELLPVYRHLASQIWDCIASADDDEDSGDETTIRILDVACGSGALFSFLLEQQNNAQSGANRRRLEITGVDLSPEMVAAARKHAHALLSSSPDSTKIEVVESDVLQYTPNKADSTHLFDLIIVNACFGNFWNPANVLEHLAKNLLAPRGSVVISHPLGAAFVARLHREDPLTVPHLLPTSLDEWRALLTTRERQVPLLQCTSLDMTFRESPYYFARLEKVV